MKPYTINELKALLNLNPNRFYVYALWRGDKEEIFYVGKGRNNRAVEHLQECNKVKDHHKNVIIKRAGPENVRFMIKFVHSEEDAFYFERKLIARYAGKLCNKTEGGEGKSVVFQRPSRFKYQGKVQPK
jgi:hypothetical protein